jgi:DMSO/TMAO reductase YedYZ heme-binding membrane subunit
METIEIIKKIEEKKKKEIKVSRYNTYNLCYVIGLSVFFCFLMYFMIMRAVGLHEVFVLRYFNATFLVAGILYALLKEKKEAGNEFNYRKGLQIGTFITLISVIPFCVFLYFYLTMDDAFMDLIKESTEVKEFLSPGSVTGLVCIEGISSGEIITFIIMQFLKRKKGI